MSGDPGVRRILPQNPQMQNFSFAPANLGSRENQKSMMKYLIKRGELHSCMVLTLV